MTKSIVPGVVIPARRNDALYSATDVRRALTEYAGDNYAILRYLDVLFGLSEEHQECIFAALARLTSDIPKMGPVLALEVYGAMAEFCAKDGKR